jgi:hypothetical protein
MSLNRTNRRSLNRRIDKYVKFSLTNAQILALNGTPITVLAAPPAGYVHVVSKIYCTKAAGTAYTIGSNAGIDFRYTNASGATTVTTLPTTGFLDQTTAQQSFADASNTVIPVAAAAIVANSKTADVTGTGAPGINGRIYYELFPATL